MIATHSAATASAAATLSWTAAPEPARADATTASARLLEYTPGHHVALAPHATLELVDSPPLLDIPGAPAHCRQLMVWQGRRLPLLDLGVLLGDCEAAATGPMHVLVVAWQTAPKAPIDLGALVARRLVRTAQVHDGLSCPLPDDHWIWPRIARACFDLNGKAVPVLDLPSLFARLG